MKRKAQNLIEVVMVVPLIIILLLAIFEIAMYYKNVNVVEDIANESASILARRVVTDNMTNPLFLPGASPPFNAGAAAVITGVLQKRNKSLGLSILNFNYVDTGLGVEPYAYFKFRSIQTRVVNGVATPIVTVFIDYRNPEQDGVSVQILFYHRTLFLGAQFPTLGGPPIVILPRDIQIWSSKKRQYLTY